MANRLSSVNVLYVKLFQALALNQNFIDESTNTELMRFTDNAPYTYMDIDVDAFKNASEFVTFDAAPPVNAGMISLVYRGRCVKTGEERIIKLKRRNIEETLELAINNVEFGLWCLSSIPVFQKSKLGEIILRNMDMVRRQTDFREEVRNMERIHMNCRYLEYVKIPQVYSEITDKYPNVIVMEYLEGKKIRELEEDDLVPFAKLITKFGMVTNFVHGFAHGDLHAGNILFRKTEKGDRQIGVLDFGIMFEMTDGYRTDLLDILMYARHVPPVETALKFLVSKEILSPSGIYDCLSKEHQEQLLRILTAIMADALSGTANQTHLYRAFTEMVGYIEHSDAAKYGMRPSDNFIKSQLVLAMTHGVTMRLCKGDYLSVMETALDDLFRPLKNILEYEI